MRDSIVILLEQPWLLALVIPAFGILGYMIFLIGQQIVRLFTEKSKKK